MKYKRTQLGVITNVGKVWSSANIVSESEEPVSRTGIPTNMLPSGTKKGDKVTFHETVEITLTNVEKRT
jgi:hypothetical protein